MPSPQPPREENPIHMRLYTHHPLTATTVATMQDILT